MGLVGDLVDGLVGDLVDGLVGDLVDLLLINFHFVATPHITIAIELKINIPIKTHKLNRLVPNLYF